MGLYFQNISISTSNAGKFSSPFIWIEETSNNEKSVLVQLTHHGIEFYFEAYENSHSVSPHQSRVLLYIPIDDPQKTGYSLLNIKEPNGILKARANNHSGYRLHYGDVINNQLMLEVPGCTEGHTYYELLLCFFDDLNNHNSDINKYSHKLAKYTREKLSHCEVYDLIRKKYLFYKDIKDYLDSSKLDHKKNDLRISYNIFLDEILSRKIEEWIPGHCMNNGNWFSTPEAELECLARLDNELVIDKERFEEIQKALLAKHDVLSAMRIRSSFSWIPLLLQGITALLYFTVFVLWISKIFENTIILIYSAFGCLILSMIFQGFQQKGKISMFLPRVGVAVGSGWFVFLVSEEMLKNQITLNRIGVCLFFFFGIIILFAFVFAEIRQHSPYYVHKNIRKIFNKTIIVILFAFNVTVSTGFIVHPIVVESFLKKSKVFEDDIFGSAKDSLDIAEQSYHNYRDKLLSFQISNSIGFNLIRNEKLSTSVNQIINDTLRQKITSDSESDVKQIFIHYCKYYNSKINAVGYSSLDSFIKNDIKKRELQLNFEFVEIPINKLFAEFNQKDFQNTVGDFFITNDTVFSYLILACDSIIKDINSLKMLSGNVDRLIELNTYIEGDTIKLNDQIKDGYCYGFTSNKKYKGLKYQVNPPFFLKEIIPTISIFPIMFIFQTILVLLIAIVAQLIISDKTVTESL